MRELEVRLLKKIPKRFVPGMIVDSKTLESMPLEDSYGHDCFAGDPYHVELKHRSRYASMDEVKAFILSRHPDWPMGTWSMRGMWMNGPVKCSGEGWEITITEEEMESIKTEHIDSGLYELCVAKFALELPYAVTDWLDDMEPFRLTAVSLRELMKKQADRFAGFTDEELEYLVDEPEYNGLNCDVCGFLTAAMALAKARKCAAFVRITD